MGETERNAPVWSSFRGRSKAHEGEGRIREDRAELWPLPQSPSPALVTRRAELENATRGRQPPEGSGPFRAANLPD